MSNAKSVVYQVNITSPFRVLQVEYISQGGRSVHMRNVLGVLLYRKILDLVMSLIAAPRLEGAAQYNDALNSHTPSKQTL